MKYGPWIVWGKKERPAGLRDNQRIEVVCHDDDGNLKGDIGERPVAAHAWSAGRTLAYRVEVEAVTVLFGKPNGTWNRTKFPQDTHKITYVMLGDEVVSIKMEALCDDLG